MQSLKNQIEIAFEYAQSIDIKNNTSTWVDVFLQNEFKLRIRRLFIQQLHNYMQNLFAITSLVLIILGSTLNPSEEFMIDPWVLFIVYLVPILLEWSIRVFQALFEHSQLVIRTRESTRTNFTRLKKFRKEDLEFVEPVPFKNFKSQSVRSQQLDSRKELEGADIVMVSNIEDVQYCNLERGDFILLQRNEQCPGDVSQFYSREYNMTEHLQIKEATKTTRVEASAPNKGDLNYMRKILKGRIQYDPNYQFDNFQGFIKLSKDPKGEPIQQLNMLLCGQVVQYTEWVLAVIISIGSDTAYNRQLSKIKQGRQYRSNTYYKLQIIQLLLYLILPLVSTLIQQFTYVPYISFGDQLLACYQQYLIIYPSYLNLYLYLFEVIILMQEYINQQQLNENTFLESNKESKSYSIQDTTKLISIMETTHVFLNISITTNTKIGAICMEDTIYLIDPANIPSSIITQDIKQTVFHQNLSKIVNAGSHMLFQETTSKLEPLVAPPKLTINSHIHQKQKSNSPAVKSEQFLSGVKVYRSLDGANLFQHQQMRDEILHSVQSSNEPDDEGGRQIQILKEVNLFELAVTEPYSYYELFTLMALCHLTNSEMKHEERLVSYRNSRQLISDRNIRLVKNRFKVQQYFLPEDQALIHFAKLFKFKFLVQGLDKSNQLCYVLKMNNQQLSYNVLFRLYHQGVVGVNKPAFVTKTLKIPSRFIALIVRDDNYSSNSKANLILLCRFCIVSIQDIPGHERFDQSRKNNLLKQIQFLINRGEQITCYVKIELEKDFYLENNELLINDNESTQKILELLNENQYDLVSLVGIGQEDNPDLSKDSFIMNRQRIIINTDKQHELVLPFCVKNGILTHETIMFHFSSLSKDDIIYQLRQILSQYGSEDLKKSSTGLRKSALMYTDRIRTSSNVLMIDCNVLDLILNDQFLCNHFALIVHLHKYLITYNMTSKIMDVLIPFFKQFDRDYHSALSVNYVPSIYGINKQVNFSIARYSTTSVDVMSYNQQQTAVLDEIEMLDYIIVKQYFQYYQIQDAIIRVLNQWNLTMAFIAVAFYIFPQSQGEILQDRKLLVIQLLIPLFVLYCTVKTILNQQEYLKIRINMLKTKMLKLRQRNIKDIVIESVIDGFLALLIRYIIFRQDDNSMQDSQEQYSIIFIYILAPLLFKLGFQTKVQYLTLLFALGALLTLLIVATIEIAWVTYENIQYQYQYSSMYFCILLVFLIKIATSKLSQSSTYVYQDFFCRFVYDIEFHIIIEMLTKTLGVSNTLQKIIKKLFQDQQMDVSVRQIANKGDKTNQIQLSPYTLNFLTKSYYKEFIRVYKQKWKIIGVFTNLSYFIGFDIYILTHFTIDFNEVSQLLFGVMVFCTSVQFSLVYQKWIPLKIRNPVALGLSQSALRMFIVSLLNFSIHHSPSHVLGYFILQLGISQQVCHRFDIILYQQIAALLLGVIIFGITIHNAAQLALAILLYIFSTIMSLYSRYQDDLTQREDYICTKQLEIENQKYQQVMSLLLPQFVLGRLDNGNVQFSENQGMVGVIFVDICQFDKIVSEENQNIVSLMDRIYRAFDQVCSATNCQKIETVGKTYMACAGLQVVEKFQNKIHQKNPIERLVELGFGVQQEIQNFKWGGNKSFHLKIGIHFGRVLMGVIGSTKPQFSLVGDTINTTSRLCGLSNENRIQISLQAYEQVKSLKHVLFTPNKIEAKGLGVLDTYFADKKRNNETNFTNQNPRPNNKVAIQKLKQVLTSGQQGSFRKEKPTQLVTNQTMKLIKQSSGNKGVVKQASMPKAEEIPSQKAIPPSLQTQLNLRRLQTKRNLFQNNLQQQLQASQQLLSSQQFHQQPQVSQQSPKLQEQQSIKLIPTQKSYFSQFQRESIHIQSPMVPECSSVHRGEGIKSPQDIEFQIESVQLLDQSIPKDWARNQKLEKEKAEREREKVDKEKGDKDTKFQEGNNRYIKFGDNELQVQIHQEIVNKKMPIFKLQDLLLERKSTLSETTLQKFNFKFVKQSLQQIETVMNYYEGALIESGSTLLKSLIAILILNLLFIPLSQLTEIFAQQIIIRSVSSLVTIIQIIILRSKQIKWTRNKMIIMIAASLLVQCITFGIHYSQLHQDLIVLTIEIEITGYLFLSHKWVYIQEKIIICFFLMITWLIIVSAIDSLNYWETFFLIISLAFLLQRELLSYLIAYRQKLQQQQIEKKQAEKMDLLACLLPVHVLDKFLGEQSIQQSFSDTYDNCTILFADIAGFTKYSSSVTPEEVVNMLKNLFDEFDKLTQIHNVFKLYTIGDCYVVIGVTDNFKRDPVQEAFNVVEMSINMLEAIILVSNQINYHDLHMRIGIHTGNVIGGIIGTDIIRYDVYGKDILIANKMESSSEEGKVLISETTKKILEDNYGAIYQYSNRKVINIPSINTTLAGYFLDLQ